MAEYLIQGETLTAIADEVRTLSGVTGTMTTDAMQNNLDNANAEVASQATLLEQALALLNGKVGGSGNSNGLPTGITAIDTGTVTLASDYYQLYVQHNLGVRPSFIIVVPDKSNLNIADYNTGGSDFDNLYSYIIINKPYTDVNGIKYSNHDFHSYIGYSSNSIHCINGGTKSGDEFSTYFDFSVIMNVKAGITYRWIACAADGFE